MRFVVRVAVPVYIMMHSALPHVENQSVGMATNTMEVDRSRMADVASIAPQNGLDFDTVAVGKSIALGAVSIAVAVPLSISMRRTTVEIVLMVTVPC